MDKLAWLEKMKADGQPAVVVHRFGLTDTRFTFAGDSHIGAHSDREVVLIVPDWFLVVAFGTLPSIWVASYIARRVKQRRASVTCAACGYDLRESPERCPECGTPNPRWRQKMPRANAAGETSG
jgi:hypothetical protein